MKIKIMVVFGTRPEAIKCAPVIKELQKNKNVFDIMIITTAQHREMLDQVLGIFDITPHIDLNIMLKNQSLAKITAAVISSMDKILKKNKYDLVLVQGDTTTAFISSLAAFYNKVPVGHIEGGLRTFDRFNPYPEEINRQLISLVADIHFAPTRLAFNNLRATGIPRKRIFLTGNTAIDALLYSSRKIKDDCGKVKVSRIRKMVLVTAHRRENFGVPINNICDAIKRLVTLRNDIEIVYPVHLNPHIRKSVFKNLKGVRRVHLLMTQPYPDFVRLMKKASLILTDSGGVQEEAPSMGKPVLVLREKSERMEAVNAGTAKIVGTHPDTIVREAIKALDDIGVSKRTSPISNPFGDGKASKRIVEAILYYFGLGKRPLDFKPCEEKKRIS